VTYIGTRDGVEKSDNTTAHLPSTAGQKELIQDILKRIPDTKKMHEYYDYLQRPTRENASEFITQALENNLDIIAKKKNYMDYLANRPGVEKTGTHGLFSNEGESIALSRVAEDVANHTGVVWTNVISLRREDAERLGYNSAAQWQALLRSRVDLLCENYRIDSRNLKWYAAFHNESHHPHVHLVVYSTNPSEGYLAKKGIDAMRSAYAHDIFRQEFMSIYERKTEQREYLKEQADKSLLFQLRQMQHGVCHNEKVAEQMQILSKRLGNTGGKKVYGYLKADVKAIVNSIVDELAKEEPVAACYRAWLESKNEILRYYKDALPEPPSLSSQKELKSIKNMVIQEAVRFGEGYLYSEEEGLSELEERCEESVWLTGLHETEAGNDEREGSISEIYSDEDLSEMREAGAENDEDIQDSRNTDSGEKNESGYYAEWTDTYKEARGYLYGTEEAEPDLEAAYEVMKEEAERGNAYAMHDMGKIYGTARFAGKKEIEETYSEVLYEPEKWRRGEKLPTAQGLVLGSIEKAGKLYALVDTGDVHCLMIGAAGVGKTAHFLYPNIEYACACGMSFLTTDTKGDLYRNYAGIAKKYYGYETAVIDLRNPTRSDGDNMLHLINKYMDEFLVDSDNLSAKAKAEKYAKITAKTIISSGGADSSNYGQNAFFYDAAEGVLTAAILLIAEFCPNEKRHIISVFKLIQDLLAPSKVKGKNQFQLLMAKLPDTHKAKWFAGAALNTAEQSMQSVLSTALSRLNSFLDSELEQILCFDTAIDAEQFCKRKTAVFLVMPEEDNTKYFIISLILQQLYREILVVANENGGKLDNRVVFYWDEVGTIPKIESAEMMLSASRSRKVSIVPMIQSFAQLNKNYGKEGAEIIIDNCQDTIFGGFAPNSESAEVLSKSLGNRTVLSGSISRGKNDPSQSLQMMQRPLKTPDELKSLPKGNFIVSKTGCHPMKTKLKLFLKWGITFEEPYEIEEKSVRRVAYADKQEIEEEIIRRYMCCMEEESEHSEQNTTNRNRGMQQTQKNETVARARQTL